MMEKAKDKLSKIQRLLKPKEQLSEGSWRERRQLQVGANERENSCQFMFMSGRQLQVNEHEAV